MTLSHRRLTVILSVTVSILLIPLVAMQFTKEVNWSIDDFAIAGILLFSAGLLIEYIVQNVEDIDHRWTAIAVVAIIVILVWAELAVGIFGSPFAGS